MSKLTLILNSRTRIGSWFFIHFTSGQHACGEVSGNEISLMKIKKWVSWEMSNLGSLFYTFCIQLPGKEQNLTKFRKLRLGSSPLLKWTKYKI